MHKLTLLLFKNWSAIKKVLAVLVALCVVYLIAGYIIWNDFDRIPYILPIVGFSLGLFLISYLMKNYEKKTLRK